MSQAIDGVSLQLVLRAHESHLHVAQPAVSLFGWLSRCMKRGLCCCDGTGLPCPQHTGTVKGFESPPRGPNPPIPNAANSQALPSPTAAPYAQREMKKKKRSAALLEMQLFSHRQHAVQIRIEAPGRDFGSWNRRPETARHAHRFLVLTCGKQAIERSSARCSGVGLASYGGRSAFLSVCLLVQPSDVRDLAAAIGAWADGDDGDETSAAGMNGVIPALEIRTTAVGVRHCLIPTGCPKEAKPGRFAAAPFPTAKTRAAAVPGTVPILSFPSIPPPIHTVFALDSVLGFSLPPFPSSSAVLSFRSFGNRTHRARRHPPPPLNAARVFTLGARQLARPTASSPSVAFPARESSSHGGPPESPAVLAAGSRSAASPDRDLDPRHRTAQWSDPKTNLVSTAASLRARAT